jgi:outer membrane protein TolC
MPVLALSIVAGVAGAARPALALQPLDEFVTSAKSRNLDNREAQATAAQRGEEAKQQWARLAPSLVAKGSYTRNQYLVEVQQGPTSQPVTITPKDQLDASFTINLPLVDVGQWQRIGAAGATADAAQARVEATGVDVEKGVVRAYYQLVATEATLAAAEKALATSRESQQIVGTRRQAGSASEFDVERARAEVERAKQVVASAQLNRAIARRNLESLTGLAPSEGTASLPEDGLGEEPALAGLEANVAKQPSVRAAALDAKAADRNANAAWAGLAPTIAASATERITNATSFAGRASVWSASVTATWTLDASTYFGAKATSAARAAAEVREKRAEQQARDTLHASWQQVRAEVARVLATRAEAEASARAAKLARERYLAGAATQLDVQQAERDAFQSEVARIGAAADLAYARAAVRLDSGRGR